MEPLKFISLFAGIEGFGAGFEAAGMECVGQVEIDPQCRSVLARHFPKVERFTDVRDFNGTSTAFRPDLICGGFPCQDLSVAGRRAGLAGERSGLWFEFRRILAAFAPGWVVIENVPGLLSSNRGRDMGTVLRGLGQLGYRWAYRVLDSQYDGVAQRRERVFIVGSLRGWPHPAKVLFDAESLPGNSPPSRSEKSSVAGTLDAGAGVRRGAGINPGVITEVAMCLNGKRGKRYDGESETLIGALQSHSKSHGHAMTTQQAVEAGQIIPFDTTQITSASNYSRPQPGAPCHPLAAGAHAPAIAWSERTRDGDPLLEPEREDLFPCLKSGTQRQQGVGVRRLTPRECEWLQGFETDWTRCGADGKEISDSARYRMLGNAVNRNTAEWIGRRIVEAVGAS